MNPALQGMLYNQMMQPQNPMEMQKQQLGFNPQEQRNAEGLAIQQFFANMAQSKNPDQLGRVNESFNPAIKAYMSEQQRVQDLNQSLMEKEERKREKEEEKQLKKEALAIQRAKISPQQAASDMEMLLKLRQEGAIDPDATPISMFTPGERPKLLSNQLMRVERGSDSGQILNILGEMRDIVKDNPGMALNLNRALVEDSKGKSLYDIAKLKAAYANNPKMVNAGMKFGKLSNDLAAFEIKSLSGQRVSDMMREIILSTKPGSHMTDEAINYMIDHIEEQYTPFHKDGQRTRDAMNMRMYIPDVVSPLKEKKQKKEVKADEKRIEALQSAPQYQDVDYGDATPEEIAEAKRIAGIE